MSDYLKSHYIVIKSYKSASSDPLIASHGIKLRYERRKTEWEGWIWCTNKEGKSAWVPEAWVTIKDDYCTIIREYNSIELDVDVDDILEGDLIESGWLWARNARKETGWVPLNCLRPLSAA